MSWEDRDYADDPWRKLGKPGGDWQGLRPKLDNPFSWSLALFRIAGITVKIHLLFVIYIAVELLRGVAGPDKADAEPLGFGIIAMAMAALFGIVLMHEFGHCIACRRAGGTADEILMWPLGGLARCHSGNNWKRHFITAVGGPLVNVVICIMAGTILGIVTGQWFGVAIPNPIYPLNPIVHNADVAASTFLMGLVCINSLSFMLLLFNLLPMFPLDGGQIMQSLLWPKLGYANSMRIAVRTGFVGAILLAIFGLVMNELMLICIAGFGAITCYITHKQLEFTQGMMGGETEEYAVSVLLEDEGDDDPRPPTRAERKAEKKLQAEAQEQQQVDAILAKIADSGIESLSAREKKLLQRVTARKQQGRE